MKNTPQQLHIPVLLEDTLALLAPQKGERYLDLTAGFGGHAKEIITAIGDASDATLVDRDQMAIDALEPLKQQGAHVLQRDYATAATELKTAGETFDIILVDLGVSSPQLDRGERGFSFMHEGPLDMRMNTAEGHTAADLLNHSSKQELMKILREYGEEPFAARIAEAIVRNRPFHTTVDFAKLIESTHRGKRGKIHPATRTFQALRIAVNDELGQLERFLPLIPDLLTDKGRIAIISFHSLEDRLVKRYFKEQAEAGYEATLRVLTKTPISGATNDVNNPRSRSAKLRAAAKINT